MTSHPLLRRKYLLPATAILAVGLLVAGLRASRTGAGPAVEVRKVLVSGFAPEGQGSGGTHASPAVAPAAPGAPTNPSPLGTGTYNNGAHTVAAGGSSLPTGTGSAPASTSTGSGPASQGGVNMLAPGYSGGVGGGVTLSGALADLPNPSVRPGLGLVQLHGGSGTSTAGSPQAAGKPAPKLELTLPETQGQSFTPEDFQKFSEAEAALKEELAKSDPSIFRGTPTVADLMIARFGYEKYQAYSLEQAKQRLGASQEGQL